MQCTEIIFAWSKYFPLCKLTLPNSRGFVSFDFSRRWRFWLYLLCSHCMWWSFVKAKVWVSSCPGHCIPQRSRLGLVQGGDKLLYSSCEEMQQKLLVKWRRNLFAFFIEFLLSLHKLYTHESHYKSLRVNNVDKKQMLVWKNVCHLFLKPFFLVSDFFFETLDGFWNDKCVQVCEVLDMI